MRCRWGLLSRSEQSSHSRHKNGARRARKRAAKVTGPVSVEVYMAILASGPCVYCGAPAAHVDHVRPLARGGWEHPDNLVPACQSCNLSKHAALLTEWRPDRVSHGATHSVKVSAELDRLTTELAELAEVAS